jgi:hypothetical protein
LKKQDSISMRILGFASGLAFGGLLQKGGLASQDVILRQLLLKEGRVIKTMATAAAFGGLAFHVLQSQGYVHGKIKPMKVGGVIGGAAIFGAGLATLGYCPGTSVAAAGAGQKDAMIGILGQLMGAGLYVAFHEQLAPALKAGGDFGKITLGDLLRKKESIPKSMPITLAL